MTFTTVLAVDESHLEQLKIVWPTWVAHRHEIMENPLILALDDMEYGPHLDFLLSSMTAGEPWFTSVDQRNVYRDQRHKMLSAFIDVAGRFVKTDYWLKIDTDAIAMSRPDDGVWIDPDWFNGAPAIVAPAWGYSKPPDIMERLDDWGDTVPELRDKPRLELHPEPGSGLVRHKRITSWCSFYNTAWTRKVRGWYDGPAMPVESQDSFAWYCATRAGDPVHRVGMKQYGWQHFLRNSTLREKALEALGD